MTARNQAVRLNYARCPHLLLNYFESRCKTEENLFLIKNTSKQNNFSLKQNDIELKFLKKSTGNVYYVCDSSQNNGFILKLTNHHLLGMYNPSCLFEIVKSLSDISELCNRHVQIVNNEIFFPVLTETDPKTIFEKTILKFDRAMNFECEKLKIQLGYDNYFVLNRCLKISLPVMEKFLDRNIIMSIIHLANLYFKCFSIAPVSCRMQSLALEATIYDFEKFTYSHIARNCSFYVRMCKLLYPFVKDVEEKWLKRVYLEIVPVTLIERFQENELESFLENLQRLQNLRVSSKVEQFVVPLSNGNFRVGPYFSFSADMLANCYDIEKLKSAIKFLKDLPLTIFKHEEFEFESANYFEYKTVLFVFDDATGQIEVENLPACEDISCNRIISDGVGVVVYRHYQVFAFKLDKASYTIDPLVYKPLCEEFLQIFNGMMTNSLFFPVYQTFIKGYKSLDVEKFNKMFPEDYVKKMYRCPKDNNLAFLKKKWIYRNRFVFEDDVPEEKIKNFVEDLISFEADEGICLAFVMDRIVAIENFDMTLKELDPDCYKATADYCYYYENKMKQFFEMVDRTTNAILKTLPFGITSFGFIRFLNGVEISPATFLMVKNTNKLINAIMKVGSFSNIPRTISSHVGTKTWLIAIAKALNPNLENLNDSFFDLSNFLCLPQQVLTTKKQKKVLQAVFWLRNNNINIKISSDYQNVTLDRCCFSIEILDRIAESSTLLTIASVLEKIQNVRLNKGSGHIFITEDPYFRIFEYENYECQDSYWENKVSKNEDVKKCLEIFQQVGVKNVVVHENQAFLINNAFAIHVDDIVNKIFPTSYQTFFEVVAEYEKLNKQIGIDFADNIFSLNADSRISKLLYQSEKLKQFEIAENYDIYLQLSATINDMLQESPTHLLSSKWLKLLPREMLMSYESATKLLQTLKYIKEKGYNVYSNNGGLINVGCTQLHISQWLQIRNNDENLDHLLKELQSINLDYKSKLRKWGLNTNGSFSYKPIEEKGLSNAFHIGFKMRDVVQKILTLCGKKGITLSVTLNSETLIMLGSFIWGDVKEINLMQEKFVDMVCLFEKVMEQERKNSMRSIYDLTKKTELDKKMAIKMAITINKNLEQFPGDLICNKNLRIIPIDLWKKCDERYETYDETIKLFEILEQNQIYWMIKLDGTIELDGCIIVTISHLLYYYNTIFNAANSAESLKELVREVKKYTELSLVCKEAVENYKNYNYFKNQISSYKEIIGTYENLKNQKIFKNIRMESNGTLFVNNHIWVKADDQYMDDISKLSEIINEVFPNNQYNKFQFGFPGTSILTSVYTTSDYQLYQYCYNMCMLIEEAHPDIEIEYLPENDMFRFNDLLSIHPRSFFHLQHMDEAIGVIKKYADFKKMHPNFLKGDLGSDEEKSFCKELWKIKRDERIEFDPMREIFLQQLEKIISKHITDLQGIENIIISLDAKKPYHGIEQTKIQNEFVFQGGNANGFLTINSEGNIRIEFHEKYIIDALKFAASLEDSHKCSDLSDFLTVVEIVKAYEKFKEHRKADQHNDLPQNIQILSEYDQIKWWLTKIDEMQNASGRRYKFFSSLKGLHHWLKHPQSFKNLTDYYDKMIRFFDTANYDLELDTQKGEYISRHYEDAEYEGCMMYNSKYEINVTTFWYSPRISRKAKKNDNHLGYDSSKLLSKYLVITDTNFKNYESVPKIWLNDDIVVRIMPQSDLLTFITLRQYIENTQFKNIKDVKKVILFLTKVVKNESKTDKRKIEQKDLPKASEKTEDDNQTEKPKKAKKEKIVVDYGECVRKLKTAFGEKFDASKPDVVLCYPSDINPEKLEMLKTEWRCKLIPEDLLKQKDSVQLKEYIENTFEI